MAPRPCQSRTVIESAAPRGDFYLVDDSSPVILVSAGIGATPVLAMAHALAAAKSPRQIWWLHTTQDTATHAFAAEVTALLESLPDAHQHVFYTSGDDDVAQASRSASRSPRWACRPTPRHTSAAPLRSWTPCVRPSLQPGSIPPTSTPNCSAPCPRSTPASSARHATRPHPPEGAPGSGRESPSPAADSASIGRPASTASSNSRKRATCRPGTHAEAASATHA